jgi:hypothetical protein
MIRSVCISALGCVLFAGFAAAQSGQPRDAWLMKNYHFTGPPPPGSIQPVDPVVAELRRVQNTLISMMYRASFDWDYEAALAAASQAAANAQILGNIEQRLESAAAAKAEAAAPAPVYTIALTDRSIDSATRIWTDGKMLHYLTRRGAHVQVRLDLVDRGLTTRLNLATYPDFRLPD